MTMAQIPPDISSRFVTVNDQPIHYLEAGTGAPIVFLHGNPTSSYLWRNVIPHLAIHGHCIAMDLIGMGKSGKPAIAYRLEDHVAYVDGFIEALGLTDITFVLHDWGVSLGLHYLARFPARVRAVAFMEGNLRPYEHWSDFDPGGQALFQRLRSEASGRHLIIDQNIFLETILPSGMCRTLSPAEMEAYQAPFLDPRHREPLWRWPQEIPIEGHPADVHTIVSEYRAALAQSPVPKLLLFAQPGSVIRAGEVAWCQETLPNLTSVDLGEGIHFLPEDHPAAVGTAVAHWLNDLPAP